MKLLADIVQHAGRLVTRQMDPESAHRLGIAALQMPGFPFRPLHRDPRLAVKRAGLSFPNPIGVAAGFDKDAEVPDAMLRAGFGFTEIGTVTPLPQPGNPRPRVFRLTQDQAVINRYGFNSEGHDAAFRRLSARSNRPGIVGVNIGANKEAEDRIADYVTGIARFYDLASYFTVNISSPNTPGLRNLQGRAQLAELLGRVRAARETGKAASGRTVPIFLKIAPDVTDGDLDDIAAEVSANGIDGIIVSNTTLSRSGIKTQIDEAGGLSGAPLFERSTIMLARMRQRVGKQMVLIGVGGVGNAQAALEKIRAGADVVQLYTAMAYQGPNIADDITRGLSELLDQAGVSSISEMRDADCATWAARPVPA